MDKMRRSSNRCLMALQIPTTDWKKSNFSEGWGPHLKISKTSQTHLNDVALMGILLYPP